MCRSPSGRSRSRRNEALPRLARKRAANALVAITNASISWRARSGTCCRIPTTCSPWNTARGPRREGLKLERPLRVPARAQALGDCALPAQLVVDPAYRASRVGQGALTVDAGSHGVMGQLCPVAHSRSISVGSLDRGVCGNDHLGHEGEPPLLWIE